MGAQARKHMPHHIELFVGGCGLCRQALDLVTVGKCADCRLDILSVDGEGGAIRRKLKRYDIRAVPTLVIDGRIKVVGVPDFPWFCGEDFYRMLLERYPLRRD
jgi:hypothetical protein